MIKGRIHHIDVWRFIAIALVLVSHIVAFSHPWYKDAVPELISTAQKLGLLGVRIFFCISGFVICRGMMREAEISGGISMQSFYIRRIYRILPAFAAYFVCVAVLVFIGVFDIKLLSFLKAGLFLCNISQIGPSCEWALGHTWSLAYEEQFYLIFPLLFVFCGLSSNRSRLLKIALALLPIYVIAYAWDYSLVRVYLGEAVYMLAGCLFALYWGKIESVLTKLSVGVWCAVALPILVISTFPLPSLISACYPFILSALICIAVFGTPVHCKSVQTVFANPLFSHIGRTSYSIYLWQQLATANYGFSSPVPALILVVATFVFAHYSYQFFELPFVKKGNKLAAKHTAPTIATDSPVKNPDEIASPVAM